MYAGSLEKIIAKACKDAEIYANSSVHGVLLENMHDIPYLRHQHLSPETVAVMTRVCSEVRKIIPNQIPCGVQVLAGANQEAIATAQASNLQFVRCEGFVFSHVADEGFIDGCAGQLLRYRRFINAEQIQIFTDIKKKHSSHAITADVSVEETAHAAEFFLSDGLIITGVATGHAADEDQVKGVAAHTSLPVLIGSGINIQNLQKYLPYANGAIVGTHFKENGKWTMPVSKQRVDSFMEKLKTLEIS
ncbi:uncharacterized protein F13E9.13, mitochondrial isoform X2 [Frankliniella occidentalis]|nr:uncharacterized protein F13E9.13, mitochondrial isoform X2 [Frankliniella occidentalis]